MNKLLIKIVVGLTWLIGLSWGSLALADAPFNLNFGQQTFPSNQEQINAWQGQEFLNAQPLLTFKPGDLNNDLLNSLGQPAGAKPGEISNYHLSPIYDYVATLATQLDQSPQEPKLTLENNLVAEFVPPQTGMSVDVAKSAVNILGALNAGQNSAELIVYQTPPKASLSETNSLGINELIAEGTSNFAGSPKNRRFNIKVGVEKFKGLIVPQGAEFSFDDNLGPVDGEHGFLPELVIKGKEGTVPEFGGGLCQVSTTTFRAAMHAGVPITARRNHAYAVQYYSPQGTDATIYPGSADLKFINDTPGAILIWPYLKDTNTLVFDFYGTKDGRQVTLEKPVVYDRQADGSMKATWTREVTLSGQPVRTDVFKSVYQSPALFHHEQQFVNATGSPLTVPH